VKTRGIPHTAVLRTIIAESVRNAKKIPEI